MTQSDMNSADAIFTLWDHIDSIERHGSYYDYSRLLEDTETGASISTTGWVKVDKAFLDGMRHAVMLVAHSAFEPKRTGEDFDVDYDVIEAQIDAKLEELREDWEHMKQAQAECRAEQANAEATYGTMW